MDSSAQIPAKEALQAVRARNPIYDGRLFFAVVTTGIYCKPSCSSRAAKDENIQFFNTGALAERAGYRACKRCKPELLNKTDAAENNTVIKIARFIEAHSQDTLTLASLAEEFNLSAAHLQKKFKAVFGLSPREFQDGIRQHRFKALLREGMSVTDSLYEAGFNSTSRVYEQANSKIGMTPGAYKAGAVGESIRYTCAKTPMGHLMLAATDKGVCFAMFDDSQPKLLELLKTEFPNADIVKAKDNKQLDAWYTEIKRFLAAERSMPTIPVDLRGSAFQLKVWHFLQTVAEGKAVNYSQVAQGINQPTAVRAAATACAKNRIALLIPCHRVLRADGGVGGYRWGADLKRELLALEASPRKKKRPT